MSLTVLSEYLQVNVLLEHIDLYLRDANLTGKDSYKTY